MLITRMADVMLFTLKSTYFLHVVAVPIFAFPNHYHFIRIY